MSGPTPAQLPPPLPNLAVVGLACCHCYAQPWLSVQPQRCSGCRLVAYCNSSCQRDHWNTHKKFCRAIVALETPPLMGIIPKYDPTAPEGYLQVQETLKYCQARLGRFLSSHERSLLHHEPRCIMCGITQQSIRIAASLDPSVSPPGLIPCPTCELSFVCENHWAVARAEHAQKVCEGGHDGLSQCALNQELLEDDRWDAQMRRLPEPLPEYCALTSSYRWLAPRVSAWLSLKDITWPEKFQGPLESAFPAAREAPSVWLRRMSDILCMPMTALYALECLNENLAWTRKEVLTIHVIGAASKELFNANCFENILHQLPEVKTVEVVFFCGEILGQHLTAEIWGGPYAINCCPDCQRRGRSRENEYFDVNYHELPSVIGPDYKVPDLAIAFNACASDDEETGDLDAND